MIFINPLFFEFEPIKIANVSENGNVNQDVARFIGIYEKKCLIEVLGQCLYDEIQNSYDFADGVFTLKNTATDAIKNLVNGVTYDAPANSCDSSFNDWGFNPLFWNGCGCGCGDSECNTRVWGGFVQSDSYLLGTALSETKRSFITDYVYYHYMLTNRTITAPTGQQVLSGENSNTVVNTSKRIDRYNEFIFSVLGRKN